MVNDPARTAKYSPFLGSQSSAVFHYGTDASDDVGTVWYAPNAGGSQFTPEASGSGLAAHVAAAKVCTVQSLESVWSGANGALLDIVWAVLRCGRAADGRTSMWRRI